MSLYAKFNTLGKNDDQEIDPNDPVTVVEIESLTQKKQLISKNALCVIDYYADWCGPCKQISGKYHKMSNQYSKTGLCVFTKEDVDKKIGMVGNNVPPIRGVPTFMFYINGNIQPDLTVTGADIREVESVVRNILHSI